MKETRSLSLLKINKELNQRVLGKLFFQDPCFNNIINDSFSNGNMKIHTLYRRRLPNLFSGDNNQQHRKIESMTIFGVASVKGHIKIKGAAINRLFDIKMKKKDISPFYKRKLSLALNKKTFETDSSIASPQIDVQDNFKRHVNSSINLIDKEYKMKLSSLKSLPYISIHLKNKRHKSNILTNEYIQSKLYSSQ